MRDVKKTEIQNDDTENAQVAQNISKADQLADLMRNPETLDHIGAAWFLYLRLILIEGGTITGTYDQIGRDMAISGKTIRNWVSNLEKAGVVQSQSKGHRITIKLLGDHMTIANSPNSIIHVETKAPEVKPLNPLEMKALKFIQTAEETGATLEFNLKMVGKG